MKFADEDRTTRLRREESYGMSFIRWWSVKKKKLCGCQKKSEGC